MREGSGLFTKELTLYRIRLTLKGVLAGLGLMIYDEILTAARYGYCYPYPVVGCIGDVYVASAIPFAMILAAVFL